MFETYTYAMMLRIKFRYPQPPIKTGAKSFPKSLFFKWAKSTQIAQTPPEKGGFRGIAFGLNQQVSILMPTSNNSNHAY